jgi:hypothetical protein
MQKKENRVEAVEILACINASENYTPITGTF